MKNKLAVLAAFLFLSGCCPCKFFHKKTASPAGQAVQSRIMTEAALFADAVQTPDGMRVDLKGDLLFQPDSALFNEENAGVVDMLGETLVREGFAVARVKGHTDNQIDPEVGAKLSLDRAQAVADRLIAKGVPTEKIEVEGQGSTEPAFSNDTEEGRAQNRRVEILIIE